MRRSSNPGRAGFTLVELAVVAVLLTVAFGSLALFGGRSADALRTGAVQSELDAHLRRTIARIGDELLPSGFGVIAPAAAAPEGADALTYRRSNGAVNGTNTWGSTSRFAFAYETGELDDGLDNDGDGLVDEGVVEWTIDVGLPDEKTVVLCHAVPELDPAEQANGADDDGDGLVDERGFVFEREGDVLRVSLSLQRLDPQRRALVRTLETTLQPRN
jgi:hypothetical protein